MLNPVPNTALPSFEIHRPGAKRSSGYEAPIDMSRIGPTGADERLVADPENFQPNHFLWELEDGIATITLNRPEKKNPLTFDSYAELRDTFRGLARCNAVKGVVIQGAGGNFSTGGDVKEIIEPLISMDYHDRLTFTQMTGDLVIAIRRAPQPVIAKIEGLVFGAGAAIAMAADTRIAAGDAKVGFIFTRVGLGGCDMGACSLLPRIIGEGRAREILIWGLPFSAAEGHRMGFFNSLAGETGADSEASHVRDAKAELEAYVEKRAKAIRQGHVAPRGTALTKWSLLIEHSMGLEEAIRLEAEMQARAMADPDFARYCEAFLSKQRAAFVGDSAPADVLAPLEYKRLPQVNLDGWKHPGYAHAVDVPINGTGRRLVGSGMTGMDQNEAIVHPRDFRSPPNREAMLAQLDTAIGNIAQIIKHAGENPEHLTRIRFFVVQGGATVVEPDGGYVELFNDNNFRRSVGALYQTHLGRTYPASSLIGVSRLLDPNALVEIEWELERPY